jgi:hypothetical protein
MSENLAGSGIDATNAVAKTDIAPKPETAKPGLWNTIKDSEMNTPALARKVP